MPIRPMRWRTRSTRSVGRSATRGPRWRASVRSWLHLSDELRTLGTEPEAAAAAPGLRLFVVLLLVWLIMQAAASLVAGIVLVRGAAPD